ncbi:PREDICTED: uncharacterized protein LOC108361000 [Rhagoletis zephyria]|uniref:uncharacterized protein LOC108361000 n=1 Tax=Rhagoletis zephyria TaxID=28612 RepID=UPI00081174BA|nr:PREDICTED: uncharacterized protein LOC108361000 [Rhagoletis zephyria]
MDSDEILSSEVQKYPFLYNLKDEGYKNALKKEEVWLQISEVLGQEELEQCFEVEESVIEVQGEEDEVHTATPRQSRRKHDMIDDDFRFFLEETSSSLKETCDTFAAAANSITIANANNVPNASASMFQGIAQIITAHKLTRRKKRRWWEKLPHML